VKFDFVLAGDVVSKKKPDPEIYHLALQKSGLKAEECICIEDSHNGVTAAKAAGLHVVATTNVYTENEDLSQADVVVTALGDPDGERGILKRGPQGFTFDGVLSARQLVELFS
jgi:beta-phosphoglucomutase-like phosphatase (HAD superfamily)